MISTLHLDFYCSNWAVKQEDSLRPILFNVHINDIEAEFSNITYRPVQRIDSNLGICCLQLILSETTKGLQTSLNNLEQYCSKTMV